MNPDAPWPLPEDARIAWRDPEPFPPADLEPYLRIMQDAVNQAVSNYKTAMGERP